MLVTGDGILVAGVDACGRAAVVKLTPDATGVMWGPRMIVSDASAAEAVALARTGGSSSRARPSLGRASGLLRGFDRGRNGRKGRDARSLADHHRLDRVVDLRLQAGGQAILARETISTLGDPQALGPRSSSATARPSRPTAATARPSAPR